MYIEQYQTNNQRYNLMFNKKDELLPEVVRIKFDTSDNDVIKKISQIKPLENTDIRSIHNNVLFDIMITPPLNLLNTSSQSLECYRIICSKHYLRLYKNPYKLMIMCISHISREKLKQFLNNQFDHKILLENVLIREL